MPIRLLHQMLRMRRARPNSAVVVEGERRLQEIETVRQMDCETQDEYFGHLVDNWWFQNFKYLELDLD